MAAELTPYLTFNGNCEEAMKFYQSVLGGDLDISRFKDFGYDKDPGYAEKVMHSTLKSGTVSFMASDGMPDRKVVFGDSVNISLAGDDEAMLTKCFDGLSAGGEVTMPLEKQVWGDKFGMFTDKFGMHWMVNISSGENAQK
ncbi:MAG TPA: VOC family protein [Candidatus Pristimantibacillus sp.]|jgi:PhnB protein|nr:VOC family protein [Candidatus Pristimantibacillus sp.]